MFDKILYDLKDCECVLQKLADDTEVEAWISCTLRSIIYKIQDTQKNLCSIADNCRSVPNTTNNERQSAKFIKTAGELLDFLLGLRDRDLNKRVVIGRNVWDDRLPMKYVGVVRGAEWIRNDDEDIMIFCR